MHLCVHIYEEPFSKTCSRNLALALETQLSRFGKKLHYVSKLLKIVKRGQGKHKTTHHMTILVFKFHWSLSKD